VDRGLEAVRTKQPANISDIAQRRPVPQINQNNRIQPGIESWAYLHSFRCDSDGSRRTPYYGFKNDGNCNSDGIDLFVSVRATVLGEVALDLTDQC
jgi:hypothetical protein